ncbi:MAG: ComEC/Rec2 family competence protein, partial [Deltaproteobacteria bacterium]|nr:ComEC/Rec2 family competence protein [Deltaproteobacteria bacterium]
PFRGHGPFFLLLLAYLAGLFLSLASGAAWPSVAAGFLLLALLSFRFRWDSLLPALTILSLCGALAGGRMPLVEPSRLHGLLDNEVVLRAVVEEARPGDAGWSGVARNASVSLLDGSGTVRLNGVLLYVRSSHAAAGPPFEIRATGRLHAVRSLGNPDELPREWRAMAAGVQYAFSTDEARSVCVSPGRGRQGMPGVFHRARERTSRWMERHAGKSDGALYLLSLTTGEVPPSSHPVVVLLRKTGLAHLLAISGINVAIFFIVVSFLARGAIWIFRRRRGTPDLNRFPALLSVPACWAYVLMAGAPVPAVRSAGMITVAVLLWNLCGVRGADLGWLLLCFLTILASPFQIVSPSFLLSYGAAFFLIASFGARPRKSRPGSPVCRLLVWGRDALIASAVAFLGTLPVSAAFFGAFPAGAVLWNLLFGPVLGTAGVMGAFLAAVAGSFSLDFLGGAVRLVAEGLTAALSLLARLSGGGWGYFPLPPAGISAPLICTMASVCGTLALRKSGREPWPAALAAASLFLAWIHLPFAALPDARLTVTALNVGKGAAHVLSFPGGRSMVVDCGSAVRGNAGERIVSTFLRGRGVRTVDVLVLTHPHEDHYGGAAALLEAFPVREIWIPGDTPLASFGEAVARNARLVKRRYGGEIFAAGGASVIVRSAGGTGNPAGANERSLVLEIRHGELSVWLPGDVETGPGAWGKTEEDGGRERILFLPHHGSPSAAPGAWISAAHPAVVISQNRICFDRENLLPSTRCFLLENGAFTVQSDGVAVYCGQEPGSGIWKLIWRLTG